MSFQIYKQKQIIVAIISTSNNYVKYAKQISHIL